MRDAVVLGEATGIDEPVGETGRALQSEAEIDLEVAGEFLQTAAAAIHFRSSAMIARVSPALDEIIERIESVTADQLQDLSQQLFQPEKIAVTVLGSLDGLKLSRAHLLN